MFIYVNNINDDYRINKWDIIRLTFPFISFDIKFYISKVTKFGFNNNTPC